MKVFLISALTIVILVFLVGSNVLEFYYHTQENWGGECNVRTNLFQSPIAIDTISVVSRNDEAFSFLKNSPANPLLPSFLSIHMEDAEDHRIKYDSLTDNQYLVNYTSGYVVASFENMPAQRFDSAQFHFHAPAEHPIDGVLHDAEMHIVNINQETGQGLVLGIIIEAVDDQIEDDIFITSLKLDKVRHNKENISFSL